MYFRKTKYLRSILSITSIITLLWRISRPRHWLIIIWLLRTITIVVLLRRCWTIIRWSSIITICIIIIIVISTRNQRVIAVYCIVFLVLFRIIHSILYMRGPIDLRCRLLLNFSTIVFTGSVVVILIFWVFMCIIANFLLRRFCNLTKNNQQMVFLCRTKFFLLIAHCILLLFDI